MTLILTKLEVYTKRRNYKNLLESSKGSKINLKRSGDKNNGCPIKAN